MSVRKFEDSPQSSRFLTLGVPSSLSTKEESQQQYERRPEPINYPGTSLGRRCDTFGPKLTETFPPNRILLLPPHWLVPLILPDLIGAAGSQTAPFALAGDAAWTVLATGYTLTFPRRLRL